MKKDKGPDIPFPTIKHFYIAIITLAFFVGLFDDVFHHVILVSMGIAILVLIPLIVFNKANNVVLHIPISSNISGKEFLNSLLLVELKSFHYSCFPFNNETGNGLQIKLSKNKSIYLFVRNNFCYYKILMYSKLKYPEVDLIKETILNSTNNYLIYDTKMRPFKIDNIVKSERICCHCGEMPHLYNSSRTKCCQQLLCNKCKIKWKNITHENKNNCIFCERYVSFLFK